MRRVMLIGLDCVPPALAFDREAAHGHRLDIRPSDDMLVVRNQDVPGMVGIVGTMVGDAGVNISNMYIGEDADGVAAVMVISTDGLVPNNVQEALRAVDGVQSVRSIRLG